MFKRFTALLIFAFAISISSNIFAQPTHTIDFEPEGIGADWEWIVSENADNPPIEFVTNPAMGGINTSSTSAKFIARADGNPWALFLTTDDGEFTFDATNSTVKIMVYKPIISNFTFKVEGGTGVPTEFAVENTLTDQWEELTFDCSGLIGSSYAKLVLIPDHGERTEDHVIYIDNIQVPDGETEVLPEPTTHAPIPNVPETDVMSIFSDAYTNLEGTNFYPNWGQSTAVTEILIDGDNTLKYAFLNFQGTQLESPIDLSEMNYMHIDLWTPNTTELKMFLISQSSGENFYAFDIEYENWISVDIPLTHFTDQGLSLTDIHQLKVEGNGTVYFDNIFFSKTMSSVDDRNSNAASVFVMDQNYPNPFNESTNIQFSIMASNHVTMKVYNMAGEEIQTLIDEYLNAGVHDADFNAENLPSGTYFYSISVGTFNAVNRMILVR